MKISSRQSKVIGRSISKTETVERIVFQMEKKPLSRLTINDNVYQTDLIEVARKSGDVDELFKFAQGFLHRR